jgi:hypothetical protein
VITIRVLNPHHGKRVSSAVYRAEMYAAAVAQVPMNYGLNSVTREYYPNSGGALKAAHFTFVEVRP